MNGDDMYELLNNPKSKQMYQYIFANQPYPFKNEYFYFLVLNFDNDDNLIKILEFLEELLIEVVFLQYNNEILVFYFEEMDVEIKDIIQSISDDFSTKLKVFGSGKVSATSADNFKTLYKYYQKFLLSKPYNYASVADLILEIIKNDIKALENIKPIVLNKVHDDSQMERLIWAMFENNLNVTKTATAVYMHRNTIINKLEYLKRETGLNLQNFMDAIGLYWLMRIK